MKYCVGIDLGSTTTKAVVLGGDGRVLGRGITNSRNNYKVACEVALREALINTRFGLVSGEMDGLGLPADARAAWLADLERGFRKEQYLSQLELLSGILHQTLEGRREAGSSALHAALEDILAAMAAETPVLFAPGVSRKSDFFRDLAGSRYVPRAEEIARSTGLSFDRLVGLYDKAILEVENQPAGEEGFLDHARRAIRGLANAGSDGAHGDPGQRASADLAAGYSGQRAAADRAAGYPDLAAAVERAGGVPLEMAQSVGTGYGRQTLPFPREQIRSEILCHGLGAHALFPGTRTVLDIGGQDTKAIQVDGQGIVTSFQMNDRCAAGCGRYLGYIADEMNLGLHELGPLACASARPVRINSTCTVFAGAELRERLSLGERREDILAGLHRAIILRAMSLLARSGGISDEFTFTGGVAKNPAAVDALRQLVEDNYGARRLNISPDSIYTGALGAALFAWRDGNRAAA